MKNSLYLFIMGVLLISCSRKAEKSDAYGNFESTEITISAEGTGKLEAFGITEGQVLKADSVLGFIDTTDLYLKKLQLMAQRKSVSSRKNSISTQIDVQNQQTANLIVEKNRLEKLIKDGAATSKQLDDLNANLLLINKQISNIQSQGTSIPSDVEALNKQIEQINASIKKCIIKNPINGTVLNKYAEANEFVTLGKSLYKVANLEEMNLRVFVSGSQLPQLKLGQKVEVLIDSNEKENKKYEGIISWISSSAEFTPKIIQTKEERVNLVYAVKVKVKNDGFIKIGMPGEINFKQ
ncbi:MAG: HlyD family efflux transporter periplasmic adaptor subunit [Bacteroidetes bacterium]|nr:HlyD family efflux transporter periplasmic adaptor subunit [Bacteroidota bacterium]